MTERLMPFAFEEQLVRCRLDERGEPWFAAKDVALALGYQWKGISTIGHVPEEWRGVYSVQTPSGAAPALDTTIAFRQPEVPKPIEASLSPCPAPIGYKRAVFYLCHLYPLERGWYILARRRPVSVRTGGFYWAGERRLAFFCTF